MRAPLPAGSASPLRPSLTAWRPAPSPSRSQGTAEITDLHDIVLRWLALWNGDLALIGDLVGDGVVTHAVMVGQTTETPMVGRNALGGWIAQMHTAMPALRFAVEVGPLVDRDLIALRWRVTGLHGTAQIDFFGTDILRVADGRIAEYWVNSDTTLMLAQMQAAISTA